ncbi:TPA: virulence factor [Stenotrophomonas maltophilia]
MDRLVAQATSESLLLTLPKEASRMYAISFDLDTHTLQANYRNSSYKNAYADIGKVLHTFGFSWQQGSVYFGDQSVTAVSCVLAAQAVSKAYPWFKPSVRDIRMLRIEEFNDLAPAL